MIRILLLCVGCVLLLFQEYIFSINATTQFICFLFGVLLLGVPHGAADLLVATQNAGAEKKTFSTIRFLTVYVGRLILFGFTLWMFPVIGMILFILFAAYHFGETDLYQFNTKVVIGKIFVFSYGLLILSIILLHHFQEVVPLFTMFEAGKQHADLISWINAHRYFLISCSGVLFFTTAFVYFLMQRNAASQNKEAFLVHFAIILFILFNLPMLLGFTFYFVLWHSVLSLRNILGYLQKNQACAATTILKQMAFYSLLAILGIGLFGLAGFMFISSNAVVGYLFLGLAVLTAPHMQIMHDMYISLRQGRTTEY